MKGFVLILLVLAAANLGLAETKFEIRGTVSKVEGNMITIVDVKGVEKTIEGNASGIQPGDRVVVVTSIFLQKPLAALTAEDKDFLLKQCQISAEDIAIIPRLSDDSQARILKYAAARDCRKFTPFKQTRDYYRKLKPNQKLPPAPIYWDFAWLTDEEYLRYVDILQKAPL